MATSKPHGIRPVTYHLRWLLDMVDFFQRDTIKMPSGYRDQVLETKGLLKNDVSGLANTMLDFAVSSAIDVDYRIETNNSNLDILLNNWLDDINATLRGKIPTGLDALAREYFRERWKSSSFLLLRTFWENVDGYWLPTKLYFVDGEDILIQADGETVTIGEEEYRLRISKTKSKRLPSKKSEMVFVQKPYDAWGTNYPTPYLIIRGLFENLKFLEQLEKKGEMVVGKALEYLLTLKKGSEGLVRDNIAVYDKTDLDTVKEDFKKIVENRKTTAGIPTYVTNFDTEIAHLIPDYQKVLQGSLYAPIEKRILAGLGLVDIVQGTTSTRRESVLNPKPFIAEIKSGIHDFKDLLKDILAVVIEKNKGRHKKYFGDSKIKEVRTTPIKIFLSDDAKSLLRSVYDRGGLSKQTFVEVVGDVDYVMEVERRKNEKTRKENVTMFPPVIQNQEQTRSPEENGPKIEEKEAVPEDKTGPESKNFLQSLEEARCPNCGEVFDFESQLEVSVEVVQCPECGEEISKESLVKSVKPEITENYIRIRQRDPSDFKKESFRIITLSQSRGIKAIIGRLKGQTTTTVQSYLFDKKKWDTKRAQLWVKKHKGAIDRDMEDGTISLDEIFEEENEYLITAKEFEQAPYRTNQDLPKSVKSLPSGAQTIWRKAFNSAYPKGEDYARRVAWTAVKNAYKKVGDRWVAK